MGVYGIQCGFAAYTPVSGGRSTLYGGMLALRRTDPVGVFIATLAPQFSRPEYSTTGHVYALGGAGGVIAAGNGIVQDPARTTLFIGSGPLPPAVLVGMTIRIPPGVDGANNRPIDTIALDRLSLTVVVPFGPTGEVAFFDIVSTGSSPGISITPIGVGEIEVRTFSDLPSGTLADLPWDLTITRQPPSGAAFPIQIV